MDYPAGKSLRMKKREEIGRVFTEGRRLSDARLTLRAIPTKGEDGQPGTGPSRCGVAVTKAHGIAVYRNRIKRVCREAFRLIRADVPPGWDFMIVPRVGADLKFREVQESLRNLVRRLVPARKDSPKSTRTDLAKSPGPESPKSGDGKDPRP
jgi:ribonuclease P protein component